MKQEDFQKIADKIFKADGTKPSSVSYPEVAKVEYVPRPGARGMKGEDGKPGRDGIEISAQDIRKKLESLKGDERLDISFVKGISSEADMNKRVDDKIRANIVYPNKNVQDLRWHGGGGTGTASSFVSNQVPAGLVNGINTVFTTTDDFVTGSTHFYLNGLRQLLGTDYLESGSNQITLAVAPLMGFVLVIDYIKA